MGVNRSPLKGGDRRNFVRFVTIVTRWSLDPHDPRCRAAAKIFVASPPAEPDAPFMRFLNCSHEAWLRALTGAEEIVAAYLIVHRRDINDSETLKGYATGVVETIKKFGGNVIVRSDGFDVLEGNWTPGKKMVDTRPERVTVVQFPDMEALMTWYRSDDYADLKKIRQKSSSSDIVAVDGTDVE